MNLNFIVSKMGYTKYEKSVLIGMFLSKFDQEGLSTLGFKGFIEAYNVLGYALDVKPFTLRGYRDEFDTIYPNPRKGWNMREVRKNRKELVDLHEHLSLEEFVELINSFLADKNENLLLREKAPRGEAFSKRLITGKSAENYFESNFRLEALFAEMKLENTTMFGCGFDFKLTSPEHFFAVEVKGLSGKNGNISLTEREHEVAELLKEAYILFIVKNFKEKPFHAMIANPVFNSQIKFSKIEKRVVQYSFVASV